MPESVTFGANTVQYYFNSQLDLIDQVVPDGHSIIITDSTIAGLHPHLFTKHKCIVIPPGEIQKQLGAISILAKQLLDMQAHRKSTIIGVGGGVITDIAGFISAIYMRGVSFGFVPTTLLAMVDAAIGGKNGINFEEQKNLLGTIKQPQFILFDTGLLSTLPDEEWSNGFAEIIKYACIFDAELFATLQEHDLKYYQNNTNALNALIKRCASWKNKTVQEDEFEHGIRKLLNFGHTAGHAIETAYHVPHGQAVALGMLIACNISEQVNGLTADVYSRLSRLLKQYELPNRIVLNTDRIMDILAMDKKRNDEDIDFIVLNSIGAATIKTISFDIIRHAVDQFSYASDN